MSRTTIETAKEPKGPRECGSWCAPLHLVDRLITGRSFACYFNVDDFMLMSIERRAKRPAIYLFKHRDTRHYLNIDENGDAYGYLPPRNPDSLARGRYNPHANLVAAIDGLHLYELPWMQPDLVDEQYNLPWERRFEHPIYIAWRLRREARREDR
jgi:hypothetical protein